MRKLGYCFIFLIVWQLAAFVVQAQTVQESNQGEYVFWTEDEIEADAVLQGDMTDITLTAGQAEESYVYMAIIANFGNGFNREEEMWAEGIAMEYSVETFAPFYISIEIRDEQNHKAALLENALFATQNAEEILLHRFEEQYFEVGKADSGTLLLPFTAFEAEEGFRWNRLSSYSIGIVMEESSNITMKMGKMERLSREENLLNRIEVPEIIGAKETELPVLGERVEQYELKGNGFTLLLPDETEGVSLENGKLIVTTQAEAGTITLAARNDEGVILEKEVMLVEPLRDSAEYIPDFPAPEQLEAVDVPCIAFSSNSLLVTLRIVAAVLVVVVLTAYAIFYKKAITAYRREK